MVLEYAQRDCTFVTYLSKMLQTFFFWCQIRKCYTLRTYPRHYSDSIYCFMAHSNTNSPLVPHSEVSQTRDWIQTRLANGQCFNFVIELLPINSTDTSETCTEPTGSKIIGLGFGRRLPEIGYFLLPPFWGKGFASEALQAILHGHWASTPDEYPGIDDEERSYVIAYTHWDNYASQGVLRKCGFEKWKDIEEESEKNGKVLMYIWRVLRPGFHFKNGSGVWSSWKDFWIIQDLFGAYCMLTSSRKSKHDVVLASSYSIMEPDSRSI